MLAHLNQQETSVMRRALTKSNKHYKKAVTRLPLGVASNFRYWGEDRTIYVAEGRGGRPIPVRPERKPPVKTP